MLESASHLGHELGLASAYSGLGTTLIGVVATGILLALGFVLRYLISMGSDIATMKQRQSDQGDDIKQIQSTLSELSTGQAEQAVALESVKWRNGQGRAAPQPPRRSG